MVLQSPIYIIFLLVSAIVTFVLPGRFRQIVLLLASFTFYVAFDFHWIPLLILTIIFVYLTGRLISIIKISKFKLAALWLGIFFLVLNLVFAKYIGFSIIKSPNKFPLGISFYSFLAIGYLIDVYLNRVQAEKNPITLALMISFFPNLTAGPIERANHLLPQLKKIADFDYDRVRSGVLLIALGLFKKIVIADSLGHWVNIVYENPRIHSGWSLYFATILARYQIFADFSGYTDIAIGSAAIFGIKLLQNFNRPFAANSIADHWRRWHISLSSWMRDYIFYPLALSPFGKLGLYFNTILVFLLLGLWHGNTINFILYGLIQGLLLVSHEFTKEFRKKIFTKLKVVKYPFIQNTIEIMWTFFILVTLPTVFFRAKNFQDSLFIFKNIFIDMTSYFPNKMDFGFINSNSFMLWPFILIIIFIFEILQWINVSTPLSDWLKNRPLYVRWAIYIAGMLLFIAFGNFEKTVDFSYRNY